jgi:hypothetical protein
MGQKSNDAAAKDAQIVWSKEECALGMRQRSNDAALKDAETKPGVAAYVGGLEQSAMHTMNLVHLDQSSIRPLQL